MNILPGVHYLLIGGINMTLMLVEALYPAPAPFFQTMLDVLTLMQTTQYFEPRLPYEFMCTHIGIHAN